MSPIPLVSTMSPDLLDRFLRCAIPLFVALDPIGLLFVLGAMAERRTRSQLRTTAVHSVLVAALVSVAFLLVAPAVLRYLGVVVSDLAVAGGLILVAFALKDLLDPHLSAYVPEQDMGAGSGIIPLAVPLLAGPAVLTTLVLLRSQYGLGLTLGAAASVFAITLAIFLAATQLIHLLGRSGLRILSKILSLILAAYGIMMIRRGLVDILS